MREVVYISRELLKEALLELEELAEDKEHLSFKI